MCSSPYEDSTIKWTASEGNSFYGHAGHLLQASGTRFTHSAHNLKLLHILNCYLLRPQAKNCGCRSLYGARYWEGGRILLAGDAKTLREVKPSATPHESFHRHTRNARICNTLHREQPHVQPAYPSPA